MVRKTSLLAFLLSLLSLTVAAQSNTAASIGGWVKDQQPANVVEALKGLEAFSPRLAGLKPEQKSVKSSWKLENPLLVRDLNLGTWNNTNWQGTTPAIAGELFCHKADCSRFTIILIAREQFTSQCTQKGKRVGITFVQVIQGAMWGDKGYQIDPQTVPLPGPMPLGDIAQSEVKHFNEWSLYRDVYRESVESQFPKIAETMKRYEVHQGSNAWVENGVIGADAPLPPPKCGEVAAPTVASKTNQ